MNRRDLFKGIIGAAATAPIVKAVTKPQPFHFCPTCQAHHTVSVACMQTAPDEVFHVEGLTAKQVEVWDALNNPDIRMVLFSGGRRCGKSFLVDEWKKSLDPGGTHMHVSRGYTGWHMTPGSLRSGLRFDRISVDDATDLPGETICSIVERARGTDFKILFTGTPIGPGLEVLRRAFPKIGWNGDGRSVRYHVNASMGDNPHL